LFREGIASGKVMNALIPVADLLDHCKLYERLHKLVEILDGRGLDDRGDIYMALYPYKSRYLLETKQMEKYVEYSRKYFSVYDKQLLDSIQVIAQILELQEELRELERKQRITRAYNQKLKGIALFDVLTGLPNRASLNEYLAECFEEARENGKLLGVEILDVDYFKEYNDMHGHLQGDKCLEAVSSILRETASERTFCARYGGDEFVIVYRDMTAEQISRVVERIQSGVRMLQIPMGEALPGENVSVSQGIFMQIPGKDDKEWDFSAMADKCLYRAKRGGRDCYYISTEYERK
jgi:diguanylate cyclase (GGDEF)-like protein